MKPVRLSPRAEADLETIAGYIAEDSPARAKTFIVELKARCDLLREHPLQGRSAVKLGIDGRVLSFKGYIVLYRVTDAAILIDRFVHGARDLSALLDDPER